MIRDYKTQIVNAINNGYNDVLKKRQEELGPKLKKLVQDYLKVIEENRNIFENYHNSFNDNKLINNTPNIIKFLSDGINKLEINEFDLDLIIDDENQKTLLDFILEYKPYLSLDYFGLGGSYTKIGIMFLEKIFTSGDKEYIKYLHEIGFYGSPNLFLTTINGKKVIDYIIDNYDEYSDFCGIKFNLFIKDNETKKYVLNNIQNGKYDILKSDGKIDNDKLLMILDHMDITTQDLLNEITINDENYSIVQLYLNKNILKGEEKLRNVILPEYVFNSLINKYFKTDDDNLKEQIKNCLNNLYIDNITSQSLNKNVVSFLENDGLILKVEKANAINEDTIFNDKLSELVNALKTGTPTSDDVIKYVIKNYSNLYNSNLSFVLKEIETLILIKKNNPQFNMVNSDKGPNFDNHTLHLVLTDKNSLGYHGEDNYATFNHEITHAIQYYCYNDNTPIEFYTTLPNIKDIVNNIAEYCENVILKMDKAMSLFNKPIDNDELKKQIYYISTNQLGYEREVIDIFDTFMCFTGHLSELGFAKADYIEGHPYDYMKYAGYDFSELLADYKSIMCSDREDLKVFVKDNLSNECVTFIENFYENMLSDYISIYEQDYSKYLTSNNKINNRANIK